MFLEMSASTCATLAQVMPVFLVLFVAQEVVLSQRPMRVTQLVFSDTRRILDGTLFLGLLAIESSLVLGVESEGIQTGWIASTLWIASLSVGVVLVMRWALLLPVAELAMSAMSKWSFGLLGKVWPTSEIRARFARIHKKWDKFNRQLVVMDARGQIRFVGKDGKLRKKYSQK